MEESAYGDTCRGSSSLPSDGRVSDYPQSQEKANTKKEKGRGKSTALPKRERRNETEIKQKK